jgi:hypothetical protein
MPICYPVETILRGVSVEADAHSTLIKHPHTYAELFRPIAFMPSEFAAKLRPCRIRFGMALPFER